MTSLTPFASALLLVGLGACANAQNDDADGGGAGGASTVTTAVTTTTTSVSSTASTTTATGSTSSGGACAQDCSTVQVPLCYESVCNASTHACEVKPATAGTACEDGLYCTVDDTCDGSGTCQGGDPRVCDDGGADPCLTSACDDDLDACTSAPAANGTACVPTTGDLCNSANAICQNGNCLGAPKDCSSVPLPDDCHVAACDSTTGDCVLANATDGAPCASNDFCLGDATCTAGACQSQPINEGVACVGGDFCQTDKVCTVGVCEGTPVDSCTICSETEANNSTATANDDASCTAWGGVIAVIGDQDFFKVHVAVAGSRIDAEVNDAGGAGTCPPGFDSVINVYDATGTEIASDDQGGVDSCSYVGPTTSGATNLAVGDYYVEVEDWLNNGTSPPYVLRLEVLPPGCGNGVIEGTEACDGTSLGAETCTSQGFASGTLGCDASCALDASGCNAPGCGDGILSAGEECDDGNSSDADGCNSLCQVVPACAPGQTRISLGSAPGAVPIVDVSTTLSTIAVAQTGTVQKLWVVVDIDYSWDSDLDLGIVPPGGALIDLSSDNGGSGLDYHGTIFGMDATVPITAASAVPPFTGFYLPEGSLTPLVGTSVTGNWVLNMTDDLGGFAGTMNSWRLIACVQ